MMSRALQNDTVIAIAAKPVSKNRRRIARAFFSSPLWQQRVEALRGQNATAEKLATHCSAVPWNEECEHGEVWGLARVCPGVEIERKVCQSKEARGQWELLFDRDCHAYTIQVLEVAQCVSRVHAVSVAYSNDAPHEQQPLFHLTDASCHCVLEALFSVNGEAMSGRDVLHGWGSNQSLACVALLRGMAALVSLGAWCEIMLTGRWRSRIRLFEGWPTTARFQYKAKSENVGDEARPEVALFLSV